MSEQTRKSSRFSRRNFAALLAGGAAAPAMLGQQQTAGAPPQQNTQQQSVQTAAPNPNTSQQRRGTVQEVPPFEAPLEFARKDVPAKVQPFAMTQVRLLPSLFKDAQEWNRGYMERLPADRLLHNFRINAGLPSTAEPFGGWEEPKGELRGHFTGHYLSAAAQLYASTGNKDIKAKGDYMVGELAKCQQALGGGYLSAFPREFWDRLDARKPVWAPFYTIHKIMAGMYDMYDQAGNKQALEVLKGMATWADEWTAGKTEEHMQDILNTEYGGMNEVLYNLAAATDDDRWAKVGDRFTKKKFFNPLDLRRDELRGLHVNTHIPQVIGAARRYEISGDMRFHDVADFFWYEVTSARSYVTGGTSNGEGWLTPPRELAAELTRSVASAECCCSYNMLKLTRHLYSWTADPSYFDFYERTLVNHRIGTIHPENGHTQYYLSMTPGAWKTFNTDDKSFWCCTGTGVEEYSKLNDSIYWHDKDGIYVNLFVPSELHWADKGLHLRQETRFPEQGGTTLTLTLDRPTRFAMRLRIPAWVAEGGAVKINGKPLDAFSGPSSYLTVNRTWKSGDRVEMVLPMKLTVEAMPDDAAMRAFLYGPVVLAGDFGNQGLTEKLTEGPNAPRMQAVPALDFPMARIREAITLPDRGQMRGRVVPAVEMPKLKAGGPDLSSWIKPGDKPLTFKITGQDKELALVPINSIFERRYTIYWKVS